MQIESPTFLAHVRATTGSPVQRTNCHPFNHHKWLFVHNGLINEFEKIHHDLAFPLSPDLFDLKLGSADSELMFLLAISVGLKSDVQTGIARMAGLVEHMATKRGIENVRK